MGKYNLVAISGNVTLPEVYRQTVEEWYSAFPDENVTILADENREMQNLIKATGIPAISLLNSNLEVIVLSTRGFNQAFDKLINIIE